MVSLTFSPTISGNVTGQLKNKGDKISNGSPFSNEKKEVLKTIDLTKKFGNFTAVDHISFEVQEGEIFGLLGPNGAGKTTTINIIVGLLAPTSGTVRVNGHDVVNEPLEARRNIGLLPDNVGVFPNLTARQNLMYFSELAGVPNQTAVKRVDELLTLVKLSDWGNVRAEKFSRGMRQRLGIAQSLVRDPQLLLFDEPTLGIDPEGTRDMRELIRSLAKDHNKTILMTSHLLYEVSQVCDRVAIMKKGKLVAIGTLPELRIEAKMSQDAGLEEVFLYFQGVSER
jgi:ABC-2 type transport system ATP-binding protein